MSDSKEDMGSSPARRVTFRIVQANDPVNYALLEGLTNSALNSLAHGLILQYLQELKFKTQASSNSVISPSPAATRPSRSGTPAPQPKSVAHDRRPAPDITSDPPTEPATSAAPSATPSPTIAPAAPAAPASNADALAPAIATPLPPTHSSEKLPGSQSQPSIQISSSGAGGSSPPSGRSKLSAADRQRWLNPDG